METERELERLQKEYISFKLKSEELLPGKQVGCGVEDGEPSSLGTGSTASCPPNGKGDEYNDQGTRPTAYTGRNLIFQDSVWRPEGTAYTGAEDIINNVDRPMLKNFRRAREPVSGKEDFGFEVVSQNRAHRGSHRAQRKGPRNLARKGETDQTPSKRARAKIYSEASRGASKEEKMKSVLIGDDGRPWTAPPTLGDVCRGAAQVAGNACGAMLQKCQGLLSLIGLAPRTSRQAPTVF